MRCKVQPRVLCTRGDDHRLYAFSPSVVMVFVYSLLKVDLSAPGHRDLRTVSRRQPLRASRLRWTSPFHLTGNFNILTLDHIRLLCWSRCDRASWKADVKIWVATLATCPSRCRVPSRHRRWRSPAKFGLRHWPSVLRDVVFLHGPSADAA